MNDTIQQPFSVLVVDDDASIRAAYRHILQPPPSALGGLEALISGGETVPQAALFEVIEAEQGELAARLQQERLSKGARFPLAFIDMRMPPGWDGLRTAVSLRQQDPSIYIVIATAFSDYDVNELQRQLGHDVVLLRKPFNQEEVFQLARTLCQSWQTRQHLEAVTAEMEERIRRRTAELERRSLLQTVLIEIANRFIEIGPADLIDDAVNWSLARLGRVVDVDACTLYRFDARQDVYQCSHHWQALGVRALPDSMQRIERAAIAPVHARFLHGESFELVSENLSSSGMEQLRVLVADQFQRCLAVPLDVNGQLLGCIHIGMVQYGSPWESTLEPLLRTAGHTIMRALEAFEINLKLHASQALLRATQHTAHIGNWSLEADGGQMWWDAEVSHFLGVDAERKQADLQLLETLVVAQDWPRLSAVLASVLQSGEQAHMEFRIRRPDGAERWVAAWAEPQWAGDGRIVRLVGMAQDITDSKLNELKLGESEYRFRTLVQNIPGVVYRCLLDVHWSIQFLSEYIEILSGYPVSNFIDNQTRSYASLIHPDDVAFVDREVRLAVERHVPYILDYRIIHADGSIRWVHESGQASFDAQGQVAWLEGVISDITRQAEAADALSRSEMRFRSIVETAEEGIWQVDADWRTVYVNQRMEALLACMPGEMLGRSLGDYMDTDAAAQLGRLQVERKTGLRETHDFTFRRRDGGELHALVSAAPMFDAQGAFIGATAMVTDITRHKLLEASLTRTADFVAAPSGERFCADLVAHAAAVLGLDYVHVARLLPALDRVETEAAWLDGRLIDNWGYDLQYTPCSEVLNITHRLIESGVQAKYPLDADLKQIGAEGYVGEPIVDARGVALGLIVGVTRMPLKDGETVQANLRILAARTAAEWQQRVVLRELQSQRDTTRNILQTAEAIIVTLDRDGRITLINRRGCEMLGYSEAELIGQDWFATCLPQSADIEAIRAVFRKALAADLAGSEYYENPVRTRSGEERLIAWHNSSVRDADGHIIGGMSAGMDITERHLVETRLRASEARFQRLFDDADALAIQGYLADGTVVYWNRASEKLYGFSAAEAIGENLYDLIIPEPLRADVIATVHHTYETGQPGPAERLLLKHKDGGVVPVYSSHTLVESPGQASVMFCMDIDLSELERTETALTVALTKYKTLFECFPMGITITDPEGRILETNSATAALLGVSADEHARRGLASPEWRVVHNDGTPMPTAEFAGMRALREQRRIENVEMGVIRPDDSTVWLSVTADLLPVKGYGVVVTYSDITARRAAEEQVRQLAYYDVLTNLPNRRLFIDRLDQMRIASSRNRMWGALVMIDLDDLKGLNDGSGHDAGDQFLVEVACRLREHVRQADSVARLGGDEFVLVLADLGDNAADAGKQAELVVEKVRLALSEPYLLPAVAEPYLGSASFGFCLFLGQEDKVQTLLKQADIAMYQAKDAGRNRALMFQPEA